MMVTETIAITLLALSCASTGAYMIWYGKRLRVLEDKQHRTNAILSDVNVKMLPEPTLSDGMVEALDDNVVTHQAIEIAETIREVKACDRIRTFKELKAEWADIPVDKIDIVIHAIPREDRAKAMSFYMQNRNVKC